MNKEAIFEACARAAHEVSRACCIALDSQVQVAWNELPANARAQDIRSAERVLSQGAGQPVTDLKDMLFVQTVLSVAGTLGWSFDKIPTIESRLTALEKKIDDLMIVVDSRRSRPPVPESLTIADDNPPITADILHLVLEEDFPQEAIDAWTPEQRVEAERWAAAQHALASDNHLEPDEIPAKPVHVTELQKKYPEKKSYINDVDLSQRTS